MIENLFMWFSDSGNYPVIFEFIGIFIFSVILTIVLMLIYGDEICDFFDAFFHL